MNGPNVYRADQKGTPMMGEVANGLFTVKRDGLFVIFGGQVARSFVRPPAAAAGRSKRK